MSKPVEMYFAVIEAAPRPGTEPFDRYGGAHAACWIKTNDWKAGRGRAIALIESKGWRVADVVEEKTITSETYTPDDEGFRYFQQALTDEEVCVIHTFPKNS